MTILFALCVTACAALPAESPSRPVLGVSRVAFNGGTCPDALHEPTECALVSKLSPVAPSSALIELAIRDGEHSFCRELATRSLEGWGFSRCSGESFITGDYVGEYLVTRFLRDPRAIELVESQWAVERVGRAWTVTPYIGIIDGQLFTPGALSGTTPSAELDRQFAPGDFRGLADARCLERVFFSEAHQFDELRTKLTSIREENGEFIEVLAPPALAYELEAELLWREPQYTNVDYWNPIPGVGTQIDLVSASFSLPAVELLDVGSVDGEATDLATRLLWEEGILFRMADGHVGLAVYCLPASRSRGTSLLFERATHRTAAGTRVMEGLIVAKSVRLAPRRTAS